MLAVVVALASASCDMVMGGTHFYEVAAATPTSDAVCRPVKRCLPGYREDHAPTATSDRACTRCDPGTFRRSMGTGRACSPCRCGDPATGVTCDAATGLCRCPWGLSLVGRTSPFDARGCDCAATDRNCYVGPQDRKWFGSVSFWNKLKFPFAAQRVTLRDQARVTFDQVEKPTLETTDARALEVDDSTLVVSDGSVRVRWTAHLLMRDPALGLTYNPLDR